MKRALVISLLVMVVLLAIVFEFGWARLWSAQVDSDGSNAKSARVYRSRSGDILIDLRRSSGLVYVVRGQAVGIPNPSSLIEFSAVMFSKQATLRLVDIRTDKAGAVDPKLVRDDKMIQFVASQEKLVKIRFQ